MNCLPPTRQLAPGYIDLDITEPDHPEILAVPQVGRLQRRPVLIAIVACYLSKTESSITV